jgi:hypothetical protein
MAHIQRPLEEPVGDSYLVALLGTAQQPLKQANYHGTILLLRIAPRNKKKASAQAVLPAANRRPRIRSVGVKAVPNIGRATMLQARTAE